MRNDAKMAATVTPHAKIEYQISQEQGETYTLAICAYNIKETKEQYVSRVILLHAITISTSVAQHTRKTPPPTYTCI